MTFKLHTKLQTTIRRIMVEPLRLGGQEVCRPAVLLTAVLMTATAGAQTQFVRPVAYQQDMNQAGYAPVVRIDSVAKNEESNVASVAYVSSVSATKGAQNGVVNAEAVKTEKALKWVAVNSPEARAMQERARENSGNIQENVTRLTITGSSFEKEGQTEKKADSLLTPIPSVMPRYSHVRLTSGAEGLALDEINLDSIEEVAVPAVDGPLAMPATDDWNTEILPAENTKDMQIPGAIGSKNDGSILNQGGLNQNMDMSNSGNGLIPNDGNVENVREKLPEVGDAPEMVPLDSPLLPDATTESLTRRQVREEDYDMPCESSEPMHRITEITNDIELHDNKIVPKSCPLSPEGDTYPVREFAGTNFTWTASNLCHNPLYFEQPALERYGHTIGPLQPILSGAQFLATIPAMPMLMAIDPPNECQYALGYYRPGSCAPRKWSPIPYSTRGAIVEGGVATALVFLIP